MAASSVEAAIAPVVKGDWRRILRLWGTLIAFALVIVIFSLFEPSTFATVDNAKIVLNQIPELVVISLGLTVVLAAGEFDLSFAFLASLAGMIGVGMMVNEGIAAGFAVLIALGLGLFVGMVNGMVVTRLGVSSLIVTLATGSMLTGFTFWYGGGQPIFAGIPEGFTRVARPLFLDFRGSLFVMLVLAIVVWVFLNYTPTGRRVYAVGGNPTASRMAGVNVERIKLLGFLLSGLGAAIAGLMLAALLGQAQPQAADGMLLDAFTAVFLGSVILREGEFNVFGTVVAVLFLRTIENGLAIIGAESYFATIIKGLLLVLAVAASGVGRSRK